MTLEDEIWIDPDEQEAQCASGTIILACMPALSSITNVRQLGSMPPLKAVQVCIPALWRIFRLTTFVKVMEMCQEQCVGIHQVIVQALVSTTQDPEATGP